MNNSEITQKKLQDLLPEVDVLVKSETGSTNADAREMAKYGLVRPLLIIAERQTGGRGRQGKLFHSPEGGLYMTIALPCGLPLSDTIGVTSCTAVAVSNAIKTVSGAICGIKWVNDIYLKSENSGYGKLCGILVESINNYEKMTSETLIIGIGVNLKKAPTVTDSSVVAVSLTECGFACDRDELCAEIVRKLLTVRESSYDFAKYADEYRAKSIVLGCEVTFVKNSEAFVGIAERITDSGALVVNCDGELNILDSGEIHLRLN